MYRQQKSCPARSKTAYITLKYDVFRHPVTVSLRCDYTYQVKGFVLSPKGSTPNSMFYKFSNFFITTNAFLNIASFVRHNLRNSRAGCQ